MQTLQKKISLTLALALVLSGCGTQDNLASLDPSNEPNISNEVDQSLFFDWRVKSDTGITLYDQNGNPVLTTCENTFITLEQEGINIDGKTYQKLANNSIELNYDTQDLYIDVNQVGIVDDLSWILYKPHMIPLNVTVTTNDSFELMDINQNVLLTGKDSITFEAITISEDKVGIYFQDQLMYLNRNDVTLSQELPIMENPENISVLMYHFFYDPESEVGQDGNDLDITVFDQQLDYLQENNYTTLTMQELYHYVTGSGYVPKNSIVITMDDGDESVYRLAKNVIKEHNMNATLFVITGWFGETLPMEFIEMKQDGIELQSHSFLMHQGGCSGMGHGGRLLCVDETTGIDDTVRSLNYVDNGFVYCYPFGDVNENAINILQQTDVKMAFTTESGKVSVHDDLFRLPRIRVSANSDMNFFIQSISN